MLFDRKNSLCLLIKNTKITETTKNTENQGATETIEIIETMNAGKLIMILIFLHIKLNFSFIALATPNIDTPHAHTHVTAVHATVLKAVGDVVALLVHSVEKEDIDVLLLVSIKEVVVEEDTLEALHVEDVVEHHHHLFTMTLMIGIETAKEEDVVDHLPHLYLKKIETEEQFS